MEHEEKIRDAWIVMIKSGCYNDFTQEFLKAIDALFDSDAISMDVRDELITLFSQVSGE